MWDCPAGDCLNIAASLEVCPVCGAPRYAPEPEPVPEPVPAKAARAKAVKGGDDA